MENIHYFSHYLNFKFGYLLIIADEKNILEIKFTNKKEIEKPNEITSLCVEQLREYLGGKRKYFSCPILIKGTDFQQKVWKETLKIPYGQVISYKELARNIGNPTAYRAVANALGTNQLPIIIPCHRVVAADRTIGGYSSGIDIKKWLLQLEGVTL